MSHLPEIDHKRPPQKGGLSIQQHHTPHPGHRLRFENQQKRNESLPPTEEKGVQARGHTNDPEGSQNYECRCGPDGIFQNVFKSNQTVLNEEDRTRLGRTTLTQPVVGQAGNVSPAS